MKFEDIIEEIQHMLGRQLTLMEYRIARFSYYNGLAKGVTVVNESEILEGENEKV